MTALSALVATGDHSHQLPCEFRPKAEKGDGGPAELMRANSSKCKVNLLPRRTQEKGHDFFFFFTAYSEDILESLLCSRRDCLDTKSLESSEVYPWACLYPKVLQVTGLC